MSVSRCIFIVALLSGGCAHSQKEKILSHMLIAGVIGAAIGFQDKNAPKTSALSYGAIATSAVGFYEVTFANFGDQPKVDPIEVNKLKQQLDEVGSSTPIVERPGIFGAKIPPKYRSLINPGEWRVSEIDQWVEDEENRLIHQDRVMELIPPSLRPSNGR